MSPKPNRPQHVLVVDRTERLSPHMVRQIGRAHV